MIARNSPKKKKDESDSDDDSDDEKDGDGTKWYEKDGDVKWERGGEKWKVRAPWREKIPTGPAEV